MIDGKTIAVIIPVRGGSKGVAKKNLRKIHGQSLLAMTIRKAKLSKYIDRIIVTSDDQELIDEARFLGADVPFVRPIELAQDDTPGIEPILHAIDQINHHDYVVVLQVTSPLCTTEDMDACIHYCHANQSPVCVSVSEPDNHPYWMFTLNESNKMQALMPGDLIQRRQDLPGVYALNGAIYIARTNWIKENKTFVTAETLAYVMPRERSLDIDTEFDFILLESYLKSTSQNLQDYGK